jgi:hypothetical protein
LPAWAYLCSKLELVAGPVGFEPMTFSLEGTKRQVDLKQYRAFLNGKYSKQYASMQFGDAVKHAEKECTLQ